MNHAALFNAEIFRKDHPMILSTNRHLATILPVALAYRSDGYVAGRVLARNSVSGNYDNYDNGASSGLDTAAAVLFESMAADDFAATSATAIARAIFGGEVFEAKLLGLDSGARTDLGARSIVDATGVTILKF